MYNPTKIVLTAVCSVFCLAAAAIEADSTRGAKLFEEQKCVTCHSVGGQGGKTAPDLGRRLDRGYTPAGMASRMWNHAPVMWSAMKTAGIEVPTLDSSAVADLFGYLYAVRYFEKPGDAGRGKQVFAAKQCSVCHGAGGAKGERGKPVSEWAALGDPVDLVQQLWNHAARMREDMNRRRYKFPTMTGQELTDLLVYLQNLPETKGLKYQFTLGGEAGGEQLMDLKGCKRCHQGNLALEKRINGKTLTDVAAALWNHAGMMDNKPAEVSAGEMRQMLSAAWTRQFFSGQGNDKRGGKVFDAQCAACHNDPASGAPALKGRADGYTAIDMVSALWRHGPKMLAQVEKKGLAWPALTPQKMTDLAAYLAAH